MQRSLLFTLLAALAPFPALAGMYDQPYALFESGAKSQTRKEATVGISRIDGKSPRNPRKSDPVEPGRHVLDVSFSSARGLTADNIKKLEVDAKPCMRYFISARYESPTGPDWEPVVSHQEPIGECRSKFKLPPPAAK
jgi:hypothetical protein